MDQVLVPLKEVTAAATMPQVKYWVKLAGISLVVLNRTAYVRPEDAEILRRIAAKVTEGSAPKDAVKAVVGSPDHPIISPVKSDPPAQIAPDVAARLDAMEKAIMLLVEENRRLSGQVAELSGNIQKRLEPPAVPDLNEPPKKVETWRPVRRAPDLTWYEKAWFSIFDPAMLRSVTE